MTLFCVQVHLDLLECKPTFFMLDGLVSPSRVSAVTEHLTRVRHVPVCSNASDVVRSQLTGAPTLVIIARQHT